MRSEHDRAVLSQEMYFYGSNVTRCNIIPSWCEHGAGRDWLSSWNCEYHPFPPHSHTSWITSAFVCISPIHILESPHSQVLSPPRKCAQCPMFIVHWPAKGSRSTWIWPIWSYSRNPPFPSTVLVVLVLVVVTSLLCLNLTDCPTQLLYWDFHLICPMTKLKEHSREINHASITFSNMSLAFS